MTTLSKQRARRLARPVLGPVLGIVVVAVGAAGFGIWLRRRRDSRGEPEQALFAAPHTVTPAVQALRDGLSPASAAVTAPHLRSLFDCSAVAITTKESIMLAWDGEAHHHAADVVDAAVQATRTGRQHVLKRRVMDCGRRDCQVQAVIASPLRVDDHLVGTLAVISHRRPRAALMRSTAAAARYASDQLALAPH